jgi:hypothetical protein
MSRPGAAEIVTGMTPRDHPGDGWTVVLRRQPARVAEGRPEDSGIHAYEIVCCPCGDHPDLDYRDVSAELQRIRGPYLIAAGVEAYQGHIRRHQEFVPPPAGIVDRCLDDRCLDGRRSGPGPRSAPGPAHDPAALQNSCW